MSAMREHPLEVVSLGTGGDWFHAPARALYESMGFYPVPVVYYLRALSGRGDKRPLMPLFGRRQVPAGSGGRPTPWPVLVVVF